MAPDPLTPGPMADLDLRMKGQYQLDRFHQRDSKSGIGPCFRPKPRQ